ncbi:MAG: CARDB domain-containing protein [Cyanobacteria bacterium P01_E01_bin.42]
MDASFFDETSILESVSPHQLGLELPNTMIPTIAQQQAVSLGTSVEAGLKLAREDLANFAREENAIAQLQSPFGSGLAMDIARDLLQNFADNDFSDLPGVVLKNSAEINHADGAYDALTGEIYLASEFVGENQSEAIASVLLEEIGHFIDSKINIEDAPGDEGEMFAALVQGESLSRSQLEAFQGENDGFENGAMAIEQSKRPDLHIGRKIAQNTAQAGESIQIWSYVKNRGKATAGTSYLKYYLSDDKYLSNNDAYLGKDYVTSLSPKNHSIENEWVKIPEATIAGKKYLLFQADGFNQVFESNEYNNVGYKRINIKASTGKADLIVSSSYVTSSVEAGNSAFVVSQVQNIGSGIAGMSNVNYYLSDDISLSSDDIYLGDDEINTLASGKSGYGFQRITIPDDVSVGQKYILFQADANNLIAESNEYNNIAYKSIQIAAPPDYAGNSLSEARDIGILKSQHTYSYDDWVGNSDANDYYKFTLTDHAALTIKLTDLSADANLQLLNSNGSVIKRSVNGGIQNDSISLVNSGIPAGTYYIRVYPNGSSNNTDYNLSVMAGAIGDGNDSLATAQSVNLSAFDNGDFALTLKGAKIGYSGNNWVLKDTQDYYKFSLFDTREVNLSLAGLQAHADLELLNSSGQVLNISSNNGTASESIRHILSAGTYYARVTSADNIETSYDLSLGQKIPKTYWQAEYFNNPDVSGSPVWIENLGYGHNGFDKDWGHGGPIASLKNNFSARMTTQRYLAPGLYHITTTADDGVRIKIGNEMVVDRWDLQASVTNSGFYYSRGYIVPIEVEYFESGEGASVDFDIKPAQLFTESVDLSSQWKGKIYHWDPTRSEKPLDDFHHGYLEENPNAIAAINLGSNTRSDGKKGINFDWGQGSIEGDGVRLPHDNFAIRAYTQAHFDGSEYTFRVRGDDGFQLLAKRHGGLDEWHYITSQDVWQEAYGDHTEFTYTLPAGVYDLTFHMYDSVRNAYFDLSWEKEQTWTAKYFNNTKLFGEPVFEENLGKNIAFSKNWGSGGPDSLRDNFSAQMTTERYLEPGLYQITTNADDGIRVKIGNQTIINRWQEQDSMTNSGFYRSSGETVSIVVEYFESGGDASLNFDLKPAEKFREFVDVSTQWNATVFHWDPTKGSQPSTNFYDGGINHNPNAIATINLG